MKVKIKKKGKVKEFKLINKWEDVTLEKWIKLVDYHKLSKSEEALETIKALLKTFSESSFSVSKLDCK